MILWFIISLVLSVIFFQGFWSRLPGMLSPDWVFMQHHAAPWGVMALCLIFLWLKRKEVWRQMDFRLVPIYVLAGLVLMVGAVLMPSSQHYLVFQVLLVSLGVFVLIFGRGAKIPSILLAIYGFAITFPLVIERFAEEVYSQSAIMPLVWVINILGYPFQNQGQWVHLISSSGEPVSVAITAACAGPVTMGVFLAIFSLMMLDTPLPPKKAAYFLLFGAIGTWFQSFIRLVILMIVGYRLGEDALWTAHFWSIYILFPLWYLLFAYLYFWQAKLKGETGGSKLHMSLSETKVASSGIG